MSHRNRHEQKALEESHSAEKGKKPKRPRKYKRKAPPPVQDALEMFDEETEEYVGWK